MNWKISFIIVLLFWSCQNDNSSISHIEDGNYLIEAKDLKSIIEEPKIKILDFRSYEAYLDGHIPGALHISRVDIEDPNYAYKGMMASRSQIQALLSKTGIDAEDLIILYDDKGMCEAARFWWILQNYGHNKVKLLHGGLEDWQIVQGDISKVIPKIVPSYFEFSNEAEFQYHITRQDVLKALNSGTKIIDTRTLEEFKGLHHKEGAKKAGRLPSSIHMDWASCINYHDDKRLKSVEALEDIFNTLNINKTDSIILYCHSGVRSAHTTFVMTQLLGFKNVKNYDGSWTEWSHYDDLPYENENISLIKE